MSHSAADRPERFSYAELLRWPEDQRWELYDGVPQAMSPAPATVQITKLALYEAHGVRCYWLVHPTDGIVTVYTHSTAGERPRARSCALPSTGS